MGLLKTVAQAWKVQEIRVKMIFTMLMLLVYRIGSNIPVPNIDRTILASLFTGDAGLFDLFDLFSGGSFSNFTIFALGITPYITASIIIQLLGIAFPYFENLAKQGAEGQKKLQKITRYSSIGLALIQAVGLTIGLFKSAIIDKSVFSIITMVLVLVAGTTFLMWLGELITDRGIGNGISLIIFSGIVSRMPSSVRTLLTQYKAGTLSIIGLILIALGAVAITAGVIVVEEGQRKIPVQYAKRVVGRKMYGGQASHIPVKVNQAGVIPIIFAVSILQFPLTITYFTSPTSGFTIFVKKWLSSSGNPGVYVYSILNVLMIVGFTYFYNAISFNVQQIGDQLKTNGGFIPGIRPGQATVDYIQKVLSRLTIVGAIFLAIMATLPTILSGVFPALKALHFGGTSLLIAVGVALESVRQLEGQLLQRNYQGFLK